MNTDQDLPQRPTRWDLACWLSATPMTGSLWTDLRATDPSFDLSLDALRDACEREDLPDRLMAFQRCRDELRAAWSALEEALERSHRQPPEPLPAVHAKTFSDGLHFDAFLRTPSGGRFQDWFAARRHEPPA